MLAAVLTAVLLAGCGPEHLTAGEYTRYVVPTLGSADEGRYGQYGVSPPSVREGEPAELTGTVVAGGAAAPAGTPYYVTIGFANGMPRPVNGIDSAGGEHRPLAVVFAGSLRSCEVMTTGYAQCRIYVMPPDTRLVGLVLTDMS